MVASIAIALFPDLSTDLIVLDDKKVEWSWKQISREQYSCFCHL